MKKWLWIILLPLTAKAQLGLPTGAMLDSGTGAGRCVPAYKSAWLPQNNYVSALWHLDGTVGNVANSSVLPSAISSGPTLTATIASSTLTYATSSITNFQQMITGTGTAGDFIKSTNTTDLADLPAATFSFWVKMSYPSTYQRLFYKSDANSSRGYFFIFRGDGSLDFRKVHNSTNMQRQSCVLSSTYWATKTWHHIVVTWDGTSTYTGLKYYLDGTELVYNASDSRFSGSCTGAASYGGYLTGTSGSGGYNSDSGYPFTIFGVINTGDTNPSSSSLTGSMDEFIIWNKALTSTEVATLYSHQKCN